VRLDDGTGGVYEVRFPDVLAPAGDAMAALVYPDGRAAAVARPGVITVGAPLEAVVPDAARARVFEAAVSWLIGTPPAGDLDLDGADDDCESAAGLDPRDARDGPLDADGDGASNADECRAGTDPRDGLADAGVEIDAGDAAPGDAGIADAAARDAAPGDGAPPSGDGSAGRPPSSILVAVRDTGGCALGSAGGRPGGPWGLFVLVLLFRRRAAPGRGAHASSCGRLPRGERRYTNGV